MVTQQILVLSFWVRVPAAQHTKAPFSGAFVVICRDWHSYRLLLKWTFCTFEQAQMQTSILTPSVMVCQSIKNVVLAGVGRVTSVVIFRTARRRDYGTPSVMTRSCVNCVTFESLVRTIWHSIRLLLKWKSCILEQAQMHTSILTPSAMVCQSDKSCAGVWWKGYLGRDFPHRAQARLRHFLGDDTQLNFNCVTFESLVRTIRHSIRLLLKWNLALLSQLKCTLPF